MTYASIREEIPKLKASEQDELARLLATIRLQRDDSYTDELSSTLDDSKEESWVSLEELKKDLFK